MGTPLQEPTQSQIEEILRLKKEGVGVVRMTEIVGLGRRAIERFYRNVELPANLFEERKAYLLEEGKRLRYEENLSMREIGKRLGIGKTTVASVFKNAGEVKKPVWLDAATEDFQKGMTKKEIAKKYNVAYTTMKERLGPSPTIRGPSILGPELKLAKNKYIIEINERNLKIVQDKVEQNLESNQLAEKYGVSPKIVRAVCAKFGYPFKKIRKEKVKRERVKKIKVVAKNKPKLKKVVVQRERIYAKKEVNTFRPGKPIRRSKAEERLYSMKSRISTMVSNDRIVRKAPPITLPKISIQNWDWE